MWSRNSPRAVLIGTMHILSQSVKPCRKAWDSTIERPDISTYALQTEAHVSGRTTFRALFRYI